MCLKIFGYQKNNKQIKEDRRIIMLEKLSEMIKEQLNLTGVEITEATNFKEDLGTDSLDLFELVMSMEEAFEVEIPTEDLEKIATVGDIIKYLTDKGVQV